MSEMDKFEKNNWIVVNGEKVLLKEYLAAKRAAAKVKKKIKSTFVKVDGKYTDIDSLGHEVAELVKKASPFKSLNVFYSHAYRSYGKVSEEIMKPYQSEYLKFQIAYREVEKMLDTIKECSKKKESSIFDFVIRLSWKVDDMRIALNNLVNKVTENRAMTKRLFGGQPIYEGRMLGGKTPRELGFKHQLFMRSQKHINNVMENLESCIATIKKMGETGRNPFEYRI